MVKKSTKFNAEWYPINVREGSECNKWPRLSSKTVIGQDRDKIEHSTRLIIDQSEVSGRAALTKEESRLIGRSMGHDLVHVVGGNVSLSSKSTPAGTALIRKKGETFFCTFYVHSPREASIFEIETCQRLSQ